MSDSADDLATYVPEPPQRPVAGRSNEKPHGTGLAVMMLLFLAGAFLAFLAFMTSSYIMLAMIGIPLVFAGVGFLHYMTWGYWLQRSYRAEMEQENFWEVRQPPVSDLNPRIK